VLLCSPVKNIDRESTPILKRKQSINTTTKKSKKSTTFDVRRTFRNIDRRTSSAESFHTNKRYSHSGRHNTVPIPYTSSREKKMNVVGGSSSKVGSHSDPITIPWRFRRAERVSCSSRNKRNTPGSPFFVPPHLIREDQEAHCLRERMRKERAHRHAELCLKYDAERNGTPCNTPTTPLLVGSSSKKSVKGGGRHTVSMQDIVAPTETPCMCEACCTGCTPRASTWG
jgi:hypothetical protein